MQHISEICYDYALTLKLFDGRRSEDRFIHVGGLPPWTDNWTFDDSHVDLPKCPLP